MGVFSAFPEFFGAPMASFSLWVPERCVSNTCGGINPPPLELDAVTYDPIGIFYGPYAYCNSMLSYRGC